MSLETAINELDAALARWQESLETLRTTVSCDQPEEQGLAIADGLEFSALDSLGWLAEARGSLDGVREGWRQRLSEGELIDGLSEAYDGVVRVAHEEATRLRGFDQIAALAELGRERGPRWGLWADAVRRSLDPLPEAARAAQKAVAECWRELPRATTSAPGRFLAAKN